MRWNGPLCAMAVTLSSCSFQYGQLGTGDDTNPMDDANPTNDTNPTNDGAVGDSSVPSDAQPLDAFVPASNLVASSAGATLVSFTSEYCPPMNPPALCDTGYWKGTNINDGAHANGDNQTAYRAAWASYLKQNGNPELFEIAFASGRSAMIERFVIQNWGRGSGATLYYSTHARIYGRAPQSTTWTMLVDTALATNETPQTFVLAAPVVVDRVRLSVTDGMRNDYWELGEFEAWGWLQ